MSKLLATTIIAIIFCVSFNAEAQKNQWVDAFDLSLEGGARGITSFYVDTNEDIVVCGAFAGTIDLDKGEGETIFSTSNRNGGAFFAKYDKAMNLLWAFQIENPNSIYITNIMKGTNGNIYVSGSFNADTDFDPSPTGTAILTSNRWMNNYNEIFLACYDKDGNFLWVKQIVKSNGASQRNYGFAIDTVGNRIYTFGEQYAHMISDHLDFDPSSNTASINNTGFHLASYNLSGDLVWVKEIKQTVLANISTTLLHDLEIDKLGNPYFTGVIYGAYDFDPGIEEMIVSESASNGHPAFVAKFQMDGSFSWVKEIECTYSVRGWALDFDSDNNFYLTGKYSGTVDFDPAEGVSSATAPDGSSQGFFSKYNSDGIFSWVKIFQRETHIGNYAGGADILVDELKDIVYITGDFSGTIDFDPSANEHTALSSGLRDIFLACYDMNGSFKSMTKAGSSAPEISYEIKKDTTGNIYMSGNINGLTNFNPMAPYNHINHEVKSLDFIAKYSYFGLLGLNPSYNACEGTTATLAVTTINETPTYQWYKDDVLLEEETNASLFIPNFQFSDEGSYKVVATTILFGKDSLTSDLIFIESESCITGSSSQPDKAGYTVYPVPATDKVILKSLNGFTFTSVTIYDVIGNIRVISSIPDGTNELTLNVSSLHPGVYYLIPNAAQSAVKFIKQ